MDRLGNLPMSRLRLEAKREQVGEVSTMRSIGKKFTALAWAGAIMGTTATAVFFGSEAQKRFNELLITS